MNALSLRTRLRADLVGRAAAQRAARNARDPRRPTPDQVSRILRLDDAATRTLAMIVAEHGWPGHRLAGPDGSRAALEIVAHAPRPYPTLWLPKIRWALSEGDVLPADVAALTEALALHDEIAARTGQPEPIVCLAHSYVTRAPGARR